MRVVTVAKKDGSVVVKVEDGHGQSCKTAIQPYLAALPPSPDGQELPEFYETRTESEARSELA